MSFDITQIGTYNIFFIYNSLNNNNDGFMKILPSEVSNPVGGSTIICTELYRQGYLSEKIWDADERYGEMMFKLYPKLVVGYHMWARYVVRYMKNNPHNTKYLYKFFKPWTEYMAYEMGELPKQNYIGKIIHTIGVPLTYAVFKIFGGQNKLDKYNRIKLLKNKKETELV